MTRILSRFPLRLMLLGLGLAPLPLVSAHAQLTATKPVAVPEDAKNPRLAPPAALPGSRTEATAAPSDKIAADMPPTEALFDAINRGDMPAAKDAISRGADLGGRNMLGLTPVDLAVDLGRNSITFLLLSMRGASSVSLAPNAKRPANAPANAKEARAAKQAAARPVVSAEAKPRAVRAGPQPDAGAAETRRFVSADPGTPVPQAGFLGFGATGRP